MEKLVALQLLNYFQYIHIDGLGQSDQIYKVIYSDLTTDIIVRFTSSLLSLHWGQLPISNPIGQ